MADNLMENWSDTKVLPIDGLTGTQKASNGNYA